MAMKVFEVGFNDIANDSYLRYDPKYHLFSSIHNWNLFSSEKRNLISLKEILEEDYTNFEYKSDEDYKGIATGQQYIDEDGEIISYQELTADDHPDRLKYKITKNNILISSLRLAKTPALNFESQSNIENYVFSNGFYIFKTKKGWNTNFVLHLLRNTKLKAVLDNNIYRGIGISAYKSEDLLKIRIPLISNEEQKRIVTKIEPIVERIKFLKSTIEQPEEVINKVFSREFNFDIKKVNEIEKIKNFFISNEISLRNLNLRTSYRWNKIKPIQEVLYHNNPHIKKLGKFIINTRNGYSPSCNENSSNYYVFGVDAISKTGVISLGDLKLSDEYKDNIEEYYVKKGDLFVSRGNTVDLVALASIVESLPEDKNIIFPDLFIKITIDEEKLNKEYLVLLFNSIIGRIYFKYSSKGKNQTMVKISSEELFNFYLPIPNMELQQKIIIEIKEGLRKCEAIKKEIKIEREKIDSIIEGYISI